MTRPRIERIPEDYAPRYPAALTPDEYQELILPDQRRRMLGVAGAAAAASLTFGPAGTAAQGAQETREGRVVEVLTRSGGGPNFWLERSTFQRGKDARGMPQVIPSIPISYGNSHNGVFDAERARGLARELFRAYGLAPLADQAVASEGVEGRLDTLDPEQKIGCKLRGVVPEENRMWSAAAEEPAERALDDAELDRLAAKGYRIQTVDLDRYPLMDGDQVTPTLAYLAGIVDFLNAVTDGPDVDLGAVLERHDVRLPLGDPEGLPEGATAVRDGSSMNLTLPAAATLTFTVDPRKGAERRMPAPERYQPIEWSATELPARVDHPILLRLAGSELTQVRVHQPGEPELRVDAASGVVWLPRRFSLQTPFTISLHLEAGTVRVGPHVVLAGIDP